MVSTLEDSQITEIVNARDVLDIQQNPVPAGFRKQNSVHPYLMCWHSADTSPSYCVHVLF